MSLILLYNDITNLETIKSAIICPYQIINNITILNIERLENITNIGIISENTLEYNIIDNIIKKLTYIKSNINIDFYTKMNIDYAYLQIFENKYLIKINKSDSVLYFNQNIYELLNYKPLEYPINDLCYQNVMLIDSNVRDYRLFYNAANDSTFPIIFNYTNTSADILDILQSKLTTINRLSIVADSSQLDKSKPFINKQPYFTIEDLTSSNTNYSTNLNFMISLINTFNINHVDFLACDSLKYNNWKQYYNILSKSKSNVIIGASNDKTGNIKYGGNWLMESTQQDIQNIYFNNNINLYHLTLDDEYIWRLSGELITTRRQHFSFLLANNNIFTCYGGTLNSELYDITTGIWSSKCQSIIVRSCPAGSLLSDGTILVTGGFGSGGYGSGPDQTLNTTEIYNPLLNQWTIGPSFTYNRCYHIAVGLNNNENIIIIGGFDINSRVTNKCEMYTVSNSSWIQIANMNYCRLYFTATVLLNGMILVTGGLDEDYNFLSSCEIYDPINNTWTSTDPMNRTLAYHNATLLLDGRVLITSGNSNQYNTLQCEIYNPNSIDTNIWTFTTNNMTYQRVICNTAVCLTDGTVLVTGSYNIVSQCELFNPTTNTWIVTKSLNYPRIYNTLIALPDSKAIVIGGNNEGGYISFTEIYKFDFNTITPPPVNTISRTYFFNNLLAINRNTGVFDANTTDEGTNYDYIISLDSHMLVDLFDTKTYQQNVDNIDNVDVNFVINQSIFNDSFNSTTIMTTRSLINGVETTTDIGTRILEILALKIFGHAKARAAIANDTIIIDNLSNNLYNHFNNIIQNHKYDIFNQYVNYDLPNLNADDVLTNQDFNFDNDIISFPALLSGHLYDITSGTTTGISAFLNNGPISGIENDTQLIDGVYNVPILFKIG